MTNIKYTFNPNSNDHENQSNIIQYDRIEQEPRCTLIEGSEEEVLAGLGSQVEGPTI